jgi:all-trans-8'-apo-beta-carotenal 15,15'-oxygenase
LWCSRQGEGAPYFNGYVYLDRDSGTVTDEIELPPGTFCNEANLVEDSDVPGQRWLLSTQYVSRSHESQLVVYDADNLAGGPVCRYRLPEVVPLGFHGNFAASQSGA